MTRHNSILIITILLLAVQLTFSNTNEDTATHHKASISIYPLGVFAGAYGGNVEYLVAPKSSVVLSGVFYSGSPVFAFMGETEGYFLKASYRYHRHPGGLDSRFMGFFVRYSDQEGKSTVNDNGTKKDLLTKATFLHGGVNFGKKWIKSNGFTICLLIGYGLGYTDLELIAPDIDQDMLDITRAISIVLIGLDGEISIGWSF